LERGCGASSSVIVGIEDEVGVAVVDCWFLLGKTLYIERNIDLPLDCLAAGRGGVCVSDIGMSILGFVAWFQVDWFLRGQGGAVAVETKLKLNNEGVPNWTI